MKYESSHPYINYDVNRLLNVWLPIIIGVMVYTRTPLITFHYFSADFSSTSGSGGADGSGSGDSFFRSLVGVADYCLPGIEGDLEAECVFGPLCWLSGKHKQPCKWKPF